MKGKLPFDPRKQDYGPATPRIHEIFGIALDTDWFAPPRITEDAADALFREHRDLCERHGPDWFPPGMQLAHAHGDWSDFRSQCARVRYPEGTYDWKYSALKPMSTQHARTHGFDKERLAIDARVAEPGALFVRISGTILYNSVAPRIDLAPIPEPLREAAGFYWGFAQGDLHDALTWELADPAGNANPFVPLLRCYEAGYYPFALSPTQVTLFTFARGDLPTARVLR